MERCIFCENPTLVEIKKDIKIVDIKGRYVYLKNIPAKFCSSCVAEFFTAEVSDYLDKLQKNEQDTLKVVEWSDIYGK